MTFELNLFARSQSLTRVRSLFTLAYNSAVNTEDACIVESSAYMCALVWRRHPGRSLIYIKSNKGPKIEPCGTPQLINVSLDTQPSTRHCCCTDNVCDGHGAKCETKKFVSHWPARTPSLVLSVASHDSQTVRFLN